MISSLDEDSEIEQAWLEEAEQRYARFQSGLEGTVSAADALAELRADLTR